MLIKCSAFFLWILPHRLSVTSKLIKLLTSLWKRDSSQKRYHKMEELYFNKFFLESDDLGYMHLLWKFFILVFKQTHKNCRRGRFKNNYNCIRITWCAAHSLCFFENFNLLQHFFLICIVSSLLTKNNVSSTESQRIYTCSETLADLTEWVHINIVTNVDWKTCMKCLVCIRILLFFSLVQICSGQSNL